MPWPRILELEGFSYRRLGGFAVEGEADMAQRPVAWLANWLKRDPSYSPQPYEQLAKVLRERGQTKKADGILYYGKERERTEIASGFNSV